VTRLRPTESQMPAIASTSPDAGPAIPGTPMPMYATTMSTT
jgi:hypothetical protein